MKQGRADSHRPDGKAMEPAPRIVYPGGADALGQVKGNHADGRDFPAKMTPLYGGRGYEAPSIRNTSNPKGSQGKY